MKNNGSARRKYKQFNLAKRLQLEILLKQNLAIKDIAHMLRFHQSSIRREIKRGQVKQIDSFYNTYYVYDPYFSQKRCDSFAQRKGAQLKIGKDFELALAIERLISLKYSPDACVMKLFKGNTYKTSLCTKTIYNYIYKNIFLNIDEKNLSYKRRKRNNKIDRQIRLSRGKSIDLRDKEILERKEFGHWEMDLVVGKKGTKCALLVLTERKSRCEIIKKIEDKSQKSVTEAIDAIEMKHKEQFRKMFKTITCDNGKEFLDYKSIEKSCINNQPRTNLYYAHPYSAYERASNENNNKLIRKFIPKGADISKYSDENIAKIQMWINTYPRRLFNGRSSLEVVA